MSRLSTPAGIDAAPASARPHLEAVHRQIGSVPNLFRLVAHSPANRHGGSLDPRADAAVRFAAKMVRERGHVSDADVQAVCMAGCDDAQIGGIVQQVALNTWTHCINSVAQTEIDFPVAPALAAVGLASARPDAEGRMHARSAGPGERPFTEASPASPGL